MANNDGDSDEARALRPLQAAVCTYRIALGPRAGQKVLTVQGAMPRETDFNQTLCADMQGFSQHAAVRCGADDRQALEQLCRYITRPALANERVQTNAAGQVVLKLKTPWRDGTTHLVMSPLEFMQRLAALVPRPRLHLIRFHGVLAANAKLRAMVVPQGRKAAGALSRSATCRVRVELCASPPGAAELGAAAQARLRTGPRVLPELRRRAEDHCGLPGAAGDREDPHAPGPAGPCAAALTCAWAGATGGLTLNDRSRSQAARRPRLLGAAAPGAFRPEAKRPDGHGRPVYAFSDGPSRPDSPARSGPLSTLKSAIRASSAGLGRVWPAQGAQEWRLNRLSSSFDYTTWYAI